MVVLRQPVFFFDFPPFSSFCLLPDFRARPLHFMCVQSVGRCRRGCFDASCPNENIMQRGAVFSQNKDEKGEALKNSKRRSSANRYSPTWCFGAVINWASKRINFGFPPPHFVSQWGRQARIRIMSLHRCEPAFSTVAAVRCETFT